MCLISYKYNFICFQIPKTGSTSVYNALDPYVDERLPNIHSTYLEAKEQIDKSFFDNAHKFTIVRNPYRWIFSMYSYIKSNQAHHLHDEYKSFDDFVIRNKQMRQSDYIVNEIGKVCVDIIRLEDIDIELPKYLSRLGINIDLIPKMNTSGNLLNIINEQLKEDFKYGYNAI